MPDPVTDPKTPQEPSGEVSEATEAPDATEAGEEPTAETFDRAYVEKLHDENAKYRQRAKRADDLARELFHARVASLDRLADPSDLAFDEALLDDRAALEAAVDDLLAPTLHPQGR